MYKRKDFPHWLGLLILTVACVAFLLGQWFYWPRLAWSILIGSAVLDGVMYLLVRDVIVCYRCAAHHRGRLAAPGHSPFELGIAERYRQERIRRDRLRTEKQPLD